MGNRNESEPNGRRAAKEASPAESARFKWLLRSQDNSKNAFKRKSVKEFRLWATDCAIDSRKLNKYEVQAKANGKGERRTEAIFSFSPPHLEN